jgi:hypothetical protein
VIDPKLRLLDPSTEIASRLALWLRAHPDFEAPGQALLRVLCTGDPVAFRQHGSRFLGAELPEVQHIAEHAGRLAHRANLAIPLGQIVR